MKGKFHSVLCLGLTLAMLMGNSAIAFAEELDPPKENSEDTEQTPSAETVTMTKAEYDAMEAEIAELNNTITLLEAAVKEAQASGTNDSTVSALESKIASMQSELSSLNSELSSLRATNSSLTSQLSSLSSQNSSLSSQNSNLTNQLKNSVSTTASQIQSQVGTTSTATIPTINLKTGETITDTTSADAVTPNKAAVVEMQDDVTENEVTVQAKNSAPKETEVEEVSFDFGTEDSVDPAYDSILTETDGDIETGGFGTSDDTNYGIQFSDEEMGIATAENVSIYDYLNKNYHLTKMKILLVVEIFVGIIAVATMLIIIHKAKIKGYMAYENMSKNDYDEENSDSYEEDEDSYEEEYYEEEAYEEDDDYYDEPNDNLVMA